MPTRRLRSRIGQADVVGIGYLAGYELRFHKAGADGSAKADAWYTGRPADRVYGVLYRVRCADLLVLDRYEERGRGYDRRGVTVRCPGGVSVPAQSYFARIQAIVPQRRPFTWYKAWILAGIDEHGLPAAYRTMIEAVPATPDPAADHTDPCR